MRYLTTGSKTTTVIVACSLLLAIGLLCSCTGTHPSSPTAEPSNRIPAGDSALPALDDGYTFLLAKVVSKDPETDSVEVESMAWETADPFVKSTIGTGEVGSVDCSELVLYPGGINIGTVVVIACLQPDGDAFPVTAYAIEKSDWFEDRVNRWLDS